MHVQADIQNILGRVPAKGRGLRELNADIQRAAILEDERLGRKDQAVTGAECFVLAVVCEGCGIQNSRINLRQELIATLVEQAS